MVPCPFGDLGVNLSHPLSPWERVRVRAKGGSQRVMPTRYEEPSDPHPSPLPEGEGASFSPL